MTRVLSDADLAHFVEHGFVLVKGVVPKKTVDDAVRWLESGQGDVWTPEQRGQRPPESPAIAACVTPAFEQAVAELFGPAHAERRMSRFRDMPHALEPGAPWPDPISHTDNDHPVVMPDGFACGTIIFLTPAVPRSGCFVVFPGSHRRYRSRLARDPGSLRVLDGVVEEKGDWIEILAEPGDALLFHHLLGHSSSINVSSPVTRHALLSWVHPGRRIDPAGNPPTDLAAIEKANSAGFLAKTFGDRLDGPAPAKGLRPQDGASFSTGVAAYDLARVDGLDAAAFTEPAKPGLVRLASSKDLAAWKTVDALDFPGKSVATLRFHRQGKTTLLVVGLEGGEVEVWRSPDLRSWAKAGALAGRRAASAQVAITEREGIEAGYEMLYSVRASEPGTLLRRRGKDWASLADWTGEQAVGNAPAGLEIEDAVMTPVRGDNLFAFALDLRKKGAKRSAPYLATSRRGLELDGEPAPLPYSGKGTPRRLRVYARARDFWLCTYLRETPTGDRLFWGTIDWQKGAPALEPVMDLGSLASALRTTGLA